MKVRKSGSRVLWYECFGFGLILLLCWVNKVVDLPHLIVGGEAHASRWRDSAMETMLILLIWAFVLSLTKRLVERLHYLEGLLRICAWCRKVGHGDRWMRLEEYFAEGFHICTTHGVCPDCLKKMEEDTRQYYRLQVQSPPTPLPQPKAEPERPSLAA
ncbi:MAG TPA: hypothetical protein VNZ64_01095 [Candidatus Acidoferrum sp.]|jgi:hypothetical protein|nr:hypothetical protein [Candidatus Acidoferrum sp.]